MAEHVLKALPGAARKKRIRGRGNGSRRGRKCGKGDKGQNARSGGGVRLGFEGGQMPLYRRIARRGFSNSRFRKVYSEVNLVSLERKFENGDSVDSKTLHQKGLISRPKSRIKILGKGELTKKLAVAVDCISASAREKIIAAGGSVTESLKSRVDQGSDLRVEPAGEKAAGSPATEKDAAAESVAESPVEAVPAQKEKSAESATKESTTEEVTDGE